MTSVSSNDSCVFKSAPILEQEGIASSQREHALMMAGLVKGETAGLGLLRRQALLVKEGYRLVRGRGGHEAGSLFRIRG